MVESKKPNGHALFGSHVRYHRIRIICARIISKFCATHRTGYTIQTTKINLYEICKINTMPFAPQHTKHTKAQCPSVRPFVSRHRAKFLGKGRRAQDLHLNSFRCGGGSLSSGVCEKVTNARSVRRRSSARSPASTILLFSANTNTETEHRHIPPHTAANSDSREKPPQQRRKAAVTSRQAELWRAEVSAFRDSCEICIVHCAAASLAAVSSAAHLAANIFDSSDGSQASHNARGRMLQRV